MVRGGLRSASLVATNRNCTLEALRSSVMTSFRLVLQTMEHNIRLGLL